MAQDEVALAQAKIADLKDQLAEKEEMIRQLQEELVPDIPIPRAWGLTKHEAAVLKALYSKKGLLHWENLYVRVYLFDGPEKSDPRAMLAIWVHKLRKKLAGTGIEIATEWGQGYRITAMGRQAMTRHIEQERQKYEQSDEHGDGAGSDRVSPDGQLDPGQSGADRHR